METVISTNRLDKPTNGMLSLHADGLIFDYRTGSITIKKDIEQIDRTIQHGIFLRISTPKTSKLFNIRSNKYDVDGRVLYHLTAEDDVSKKALCVYAEAMWIDAGAGFNEPIPYEIRKSECIDDVLLWLGSHVTPYDMSIDEFIFGN